MFKLFSVVFLLCLLSINTSSIRRRTINSSCSSNSDCSNGQFCSKETCATSSFGVCKVKPQACNRMYKPVCGCDQKDYSNDCVAASVGVNVLRVGKCTTSGSVCIASSDCAESEYCKKDNCKALEGVCSKRPDVCPQVHNPICGCDGVTWTNDCTAASNGVNTDRKGSCSETPTTGKDCSKNNDCATIEFCELSQCYGTNGTCQLKPEVCTQEIDPVCGCDGNTYFSACRALQAGVVIAQKGECAKHVENRCQDNTACDPDQFCSKSSCKSGTGVCKLRPKLCNLVYAPVCGCDGQTYANACTAETAGVNLESKMECGSLSS